MATETLLGYSALLEISTDGGTTYTKIAKLTDVALTVKGDTVETTNKDGGGWKSFMPGLREWSAKADYLYIEADAAQEDVYDALVNGSMIQCKFYHVAGTGHPAYTGDAIVTNWEPSGKQDDAAAVSVELQGSGPLTKAAQA